MKVRRVSDLQVSSAEDTEYKKNTLSIYLAQHKMSFGNLIYLFDGDKVRQSKQGKKDIPWCIDR